MPAGAGADRTAGRHRADAGAPHVGKETPYARPVGNG